MVKVEPVVTTLVGPLVGSASDWLATVAEIPSQSMNDPLCQLPTRENPGPSHHLTWAEVDCHDPETTAYPERWYRTRLLSLCGVFEGVRAYVGSRPIHVASGFRTRAWNLSEGGRELSRHPQGRALDLWKPRGLMLHVFHKLVREYAGFDKRLRGLGYYRWGVHIDVRPAEHLAVWNMIARATPVHDRVG